MQVTVSVVSLGICADFSSVDQETYLDSMRAWLRAPRPREFARKHGITAERDLRPVEAFRLRGQITRIPGATRWCPRNPR